MRRQLDSATRSDADEMPRAVFWWKSAHSPEARAGRPRRLADRDPLVRRDLPVRAVLALVDRTLRGHLARRLLIHGRSHANAQHRERRQHTDRAITVPDSGKHALSPRF